MHAKDLPLNDLLEERQQWVIPVYQRHYSWRSDPDGQIPNLWNDLEAAATRDLNGDKPLPHFVGAILFKDADDQPFGTVKRRNLVDGQQRITTFSIALCAAREVSREHDLSNLADAIEAYLLNATSGSMDNPEREQLKLWPSVVDRPVYLAMMQGGSARLREAYPEAFFRNGRVNAKIATRMIAAFECFTKNIRAFLVEQAEAGHDAERALSSLLQGLLKTFQIVTIQLTAADDAQGIFASLNGNAEPLTAFDLIRNDVFNRVSRGSEDEEGIYDRHWQRLEAPFWKKEVKQGRAKRPRTDHMIAHTLVAELAREVNLGQVANDYRTYAEAGGFTSVEDEVKHLLSYAEAYRRVEEPAAGTAEERVAGFLKAWDLSTFHPLLLWLGREGVAVEARRSVYATIESYVLRRDLCNLTRKNYNRVTHALLREAHAAGHGSVLTHIRGLEGDATRFPKDAEVVQALLDQPLYKTFTSAKLRYLFLRLEEDARTAKHEAVPVSIDGLTVEHVMPRKWAAHWPLPDGTKVDAETRAELMEHHPAQCTPAVLSQVDARTNVLHTIGNLTAVTSALNPAMGKRGWDRKRQEIGGSLLALNRDIAEAETWGEAAIEARGRHLAARIIKLWPREAAGEA